MSSATITKTIFIKAAPETVWSYLIDKNKLGQWFHPAVANLVLDQDYELYATEEARSDEKMCWGRVIEMQAPTRLVYTFTVKPLQGAMTTVSWSLESVAGGTRLTMVHEGVEEAAGEAALGLLCALDKGWDEHFGRLRTVSAAA